jgi:hypothetical protein
MVLCEYATQDRHGSPILAGIFRGVNAETFPAKLAPFWIAMEIEAEPNEVGEQTFYLRFVDEDGGVIQEEVLETIFHRHPQMRSSYMYAATILTIRREIFSAGTYRFDLIWNDEILQQLRLEIG